MNIYETLLLFALVCALAAVFVLWAKWEEEKLKTREEHDRRWDEISRATGIENELEKSKAREKCSANAVIWFADELKRAKAEAKVFRSNFESCRNGNMILQDKLSSLLCPMNDHVWKDGRCAKCGRMKDA